MSQFFNTAATLFLIGSLLFFSIHLEAQDNGQQSNDAGINFFHGTWEEALVKAQAEEKLIFVDAFAVWCGPCKVFTDAEVGEYYNSQFVNIKMDMEKTPGRAFGDKYPVSAFPTLFYIDAKGEVLKKVVGGRGVPEFLKLGESIAGSYDRSGDLAKLYEDGDRTYEVVLKYVKALNNANKPSLKIANDYLREKKDLTEEQKAEFLYESLTSADSRLFKLFINEKTAITALKGETSFAQKIEDACWNTIETAINFESPDLLTEAKEKMSSYAKDKSSEFKYYADYRYAKATADVTMLDKAAVKIAKELAKDDATKLHDLCNEILQYKNLDPKIINSSEKIAKMAADKKESAEHVFTYSKILAENNKHKKAIKTAEKALDMVKEGSKEAKMIEEWIAELKA